MDVKLNAGFKRLLGIGEQFGNDDDEPGYSLEMRRWTREFDCQDYVLEVKDLSRARSTKRLINAADDAEAVGLATTINERIKWAGANFEPQSSGWWAEITYIVGKVADTAMGVT